MDLNIMFGNLLKAQRPNTIRAAIFAFHCFIFKLLWPFDFFLFSLYHSKWQVYSEKIKWNYTGNSSRSNEHVYNHLSQNSCVFLCISQDFRSKNFPFSPSCGHLTCDLRVRNEYNI